MRKLLLLLLILLSAAARPLAAAETYSDGLIPAWLDMQGISHARTSSTDWAVAAMSGLRVPGSDMLVLVDGRPLRSDFFPVTRWWALPVSPDEIERVELVKRPDAVRWGPNAANGSLNIVTKPASRVRGASFRAGAGTLSGQNSSVLYGGAWKQWHYKISGGQRRNNNFENPQWGRTPSSRSGSNHNINLTIERKGIALLADGDLSLSSGFDQVETDVWSQMGPARTNAVYGHTKLDYKKDQWELSLTHGFDSAHADTVGLEPVAITNHTADFSMKRAIKPVDGFTAEVGYLLRYSYAEAGALFTGKPDRGNYNQTYQFVNAALDTTIPIPANPDPLATDNDDRLIQGVSLQNTLTIIPRTTLTLGGRYDKFRPGDEFYSFHFGVETTPLDGHRFAASVDRGYTLPSLFDVYSRGVFFPTAADFPPEYGRFMSTITGLAAAPLDLFDHTVMPVRIIGHESNRPVAVNSVRGGYTMTAVRNLTFSANGFMKERTDLLVPVINHYQDITSIPLVNGIVGNLAPTHPINNLIPREVRIVNAGREEIWGAGAEVRYSFKRLGLLVFTRYDYQTHSGDVAGLRGPVHTESIGFGQAIPLPKESGLFLGSTLKHVGPRSFSALGSILPPRQIMENRNKNFANTIGYFVGGTGAFPWEYSEARLRPYLDLSMIARYRFNKRAEISLRGTNLINDRHREYVGTDIVARELSAELSLTF